MNYYKNINQIIILLSTVVFFSACDTVVDVELEESTPTITIDAFINDLPAKQQITINFSQAYFDNSAFVPASDATVSIQNSSTGEMYVFEESEESKGIYEWTPTAGQRIGNPGDEFTLTVDYLGEQYEAASSMGRVPTIDSINFVLEEGTLGGDDYYAATFFAQDFEGVGDTYWFKAHKNGEWLNDPELINVAYDAGESRGSQNDGGFFEFDLRNNINPVEEEDRYVFGDRVRVEIHSITEETFFFFTEMIEVINRPGGFGELFAEPLSNLSTNIKKVQGDGNFPVLGFFSVSAVSQKEVLFSAEVVSSTD